MKKLLTALLVTVLMLACIAPLTLAEGNPLDHNGDGQLIIGVEVQTMSNQWHIDYAADLEKFWYENGADKVIISSSELDVNKGISDMESFLAAGADAAFIVPDSIDAIKDVVATLRADGMLISVNCPLAQCESDVGGTFDHYQFGAFVGQAAGEWLLSKGFEKEKVVLDSYPCAKQELLDRYNGMKETLLKLCPDIQIMMENVSADAAVAATNAEMALTAYPDIKAYLTLWDGLTTFEVMKTMGYNREDFGLFCGEQSEAQAKTLISEEAYRSFLIFGTDDSNLLCSYEMLKALKGEEFSSEAVSVSPGPCTKDNVYDYYPELKK